MESSIPIIQTGSDMIEIFIKYPMHYFPLLKKEKIIGYISKKKVLRYSTNQGFLDKRILEVLNLVLENLGHDIFFKDISEKEIKQIPYLKWAPHYFTIHKKNKLDFFQKYKPVERITSEDIMSMIETHDFPIVAFDGSGNLLMENQAAIRIRTLTQIKKSSNPYLNWIKRVDVKLNKSIKKRITGTKTYNGYKCVYHLKSYYFQQALVNLVIFLSFQKRPKE